MAQTNEELEHSKGVCWPWNLHAGQGPLEYSMGSG